MPLALDPNETFVIVLKSDQPKPEADQARFHFRYLSARKWREVAKVGNDQAAIDKLSMGEALDAILNAIRVNFLRWENVRRPDGREIPSEPANLEDVLTVGEAWDLYWASLRQVRLDPEQKKSSESPSPSPTAASAEPADPESAATDPANASPSSSSVPPAPDKGATTAPLTATSGSPSAHSSTPATRSGT